MTAEPDERVLVEVCVDDLAGALAAEAGGADRIELCADLVEGGTTPSAGLLAEVLAAVRSVGVRVMVRPRGGDFVLDADDLRVMLADVAVIRSLAVDAAVPVGLVLGALTADGRVDEEALSRLLGAAGGMPVTFHKAFDAARDPIEAYETLRAHAGVDRVLTSGGAGTAQEGAEVLAALVARSSGGPAVLAGGSVRAGTAAGLIARTGVREVHLRAQRASSRGDGTLATDPALVRDVVSAVREGRIPIGGPVAVIAIDVGGTNLKGAVLDSDGTVLVERTDRADADPAESLRRVLALAGDLQEAAREASVTVLAAGVVAPGLVDEAEGVVRFSSSLGWHDVPLGPLLAAALGVPVAVGHDVRAAGLAEHVLGGAHDGDSVVIAIGTGMAASLRSGDRPISGALGASGEVGHIPVRPDGERCTCGQIGCVEAYMSGAALARRYAARSPEGPRTAAEIVARLEVDAVASEVWDDGVDALARGIATLTLLLDPAVVVLAGGVAQAGAALLEPVRRRVRELLVWREPPVIRISGLGPEAGRLGAALLAFAEADLPDALRSRETTAR